MKTKMTKALVIALVLLVAIPILTACPGNGGIKDGTYTNDDGTMSYTFKGKTMIMSTMAAGQVYSIDYQYSYKDGVLSHWLAATPTPVTSFEVDYDGGDTLGTYPMGRKMAGVDIPPIVFTRK